MLSEWESRHVHNVLSIGTRELWTVRKFWIIQTVVFFYFVIVFSIFSVFYLFQPTTLVFWGVFTAIVYRFLWVDCPIHKNKRRNHCFFCSDECKNCFLDFIPESPRTAVFEAEEYIDLLCPECRMGDFNARVERRNKRIRESFWEDFCKWCRRLFPEHYYLGTRLKPIPRIVERMQDEIFNVLAGSDMEIFNIDYKFRIEANAILNKAAMERIHTRLSEQLGSDRIKMICTYTEDDTEISFVVDENKPSSGYQPVTYVRLEDSILEQEDHGVVLDMPQGDDLDDYSSDSSNYSSDEDDEHPDVFIHVNE